MLISRVSSSSTYLATGSIVTAQDSRVTVLTSSTSSTLLISLATRADIGQYSCEISSSPPVHLTHWLRLAGKG